MHYAPSNIGCAAVPRDNLYLVSIAGGASFATVYVERLTFFRLTFCIEQ